MSAGKILLLFILFFTSSLHSQNTRSFGQPHFSPRQIMDSLHKAYPSFIGEVEMHSGDLAFKVRGTWVFWANGRLLPQNLRSMSEDYSSWPFYPYSPLYNPPLPEFSPEEKERVNNRLEDRESNPVSRHAHFYSQLYRIHDKESAWAMMKTTHFLSNKLMIHRDLLEDLARVEEQLQKAMVHDVELKNYVESIALVSAYNWRFIAGTKTLSNHSYGIAIDFVPRDYQGKHAYWRWFKEEFPEWYSLPWEMRYLPPESFVKAFETEGFIWGGKWFFFDGIHFEYRPEIMILNGLS